MKISFNPLNTFKIKNHNQKENYSPIRYRYNLKCDTVSFGAKKPAFQKIRELPKDAFLSEGLREYVLYQIGEKDIIELHKEYYKPLLDCKTLDEAKELYPEFQDVVDTKNIDPSKSNSYIIGQIARGEFSGLTMENASLEFLKRYVGELKKMQNDNINYFYISYPTTQKLIKFLNISLDERYKAILRNQRLSESHKSNWQDEEYKEKHSKRWQEGGKTQFSRAMNIRWQNEEFMKTHQIISLAKKLASTILHTTHVPTKKETGEMQKQILANWGFYENDRNVDEILKLAQKLCQHYNL